MTDRTTPPLSILDLAPVPEGSTPAQALRNSRDLAQHAERWGYNRYWLAEHHNMVGIASAATAVAIGYVAERHQQIRVGSGGIMLPNHSPLVSPSNSARWNRSIPAASTSASAARRARTSSRCAPCAARPTPPRPFRSDVLELQALLAPLQPGQSVQAVPGTGLEVPLWILGSSLFGAQLAAMLGLPYAFASHFAPDALMQALQVYRATFEPSRQLAGPYAMAGVNVVVADTDAEARRLFTSAQQAFANLLRGARGQLRPPIDDIEAYWSPAEKLRASNMLTYAFVGAPDTVRRGLEAFLERDGRRRIDRRFSHL